VSVCAGDTRDMLDQQFWGFSLYHPALWEFPLCHPLDRGAGQKKLSVQA